MDKIVKRIDTLLNQWKNEHKIVSETITGEIQLKNIEVDGNLIIYATETSEVGDVNVTNGDLFIYCGKVGNIKCEHGSVLFVAKDGFHVGGFNVKCDINFVSFSEEMNVNGIINAKDINVSRLMLKTNAIEASGDLIISDNA